MNMDKTFTDHEISVVGTEVLESYHYITPDRLLFHPSNKLFCV